MTTDTATATATTGATTTMTTTPAARADTANGVPWRLLFAAAMLLALAYLVFAVMTYARADDAGMSETVWSRSTLVLQGFEALAFTAVGWLFGREVHRGEAKVATEQAQEAKQDAGRAEHAAEVARAESAEARGNERGALERAAAAETAGWRLAEAVRARTGTAGWVDGEGGDERSPADGPTAPPAGTDPLRDLADRLFPSH